MPSNIAQNKLVDAFRRNAYAHAELEGPSYHSHDKEIIDLQESSTGIYELPNADFNYTSMPRINNTQSNQPYKGYMELPPKSIDNFTNLIQKWKGKLTQETKKKKLFAVEKFLSDVLSTYMGNDNTLNIQCIDDEVLRISIWEAILENETVRCILDSKTGIILDILDARVDGMLIYYEQTHGSFKWSIGFSNTEKKEEGMIPLFQKIFIICRMDAIATLAHILNIELDNLFNVYDVPPRVAETKSSANLKNIIPQHVPLQNTEPHASSILELKDTIFINGNAGQIIGAITMYRLGIYTICLPTTVANGTLSIGLHKPSGFLLNQDKIDKNPYATVVICQDIRTAIALDKLVQESSIVSDTQYIVTGHIGFNLDVIPWNYLYQHDVILMLAPSEECFLRIEEYQNVMTKAAVKSFKIYPHLLLFSKPNVQGINIDQNSLNVVAAELVDNIQFVWDIESISTWAQKIASDSLSYNDFIQYGQHIGIFVIPKKDRIASETTLTPSFNLMDATPSVQNISETTLSDIFPLDAVTTIHGKKDVGKSYIVLTYILSILSNQKAFGFEVGYGQPIRCLLVDSETTQQNLSNRIHQMGLDTYIGKELHVISILSNMNNIWGKLDLAQEEHRKMLEDYILRNRINYVFLDNLTSLTRGGAIYNTKTIGSIFVWTESLRHMGIGVCLIHHTLDEKGRSSVLSKARGSDELSIRSHSEIIIIGKREIVANERYCDIVGKYAHCDGIVLGLYFKVCKAAGVLTGKICWYYLPYSGNTWEHIAITNTNGDVIEEHTSALLRDPTYIADKLVSPEPFASIDDVKIKAGTAHSETSLSRDANKLLQKMNESKNTDITRAEVEKILPCKGDKALSVIKELELQDFLIRENGGRSTCYVRTTKQMP